MSLFQPQSSLIASPDMRAPLERLGMLSRITIDSHLPPGSLYLATPEAMQLSPKFDFKPVWNKPYSEGLVPDGYEPVLLLSEGLDLDEAFIIETNDWLIKTLGVRKEFEPSLAMREWLFARPQFDILPQCFV